MLVDVVQKKKEQNFLHGGPLGYTSRTAEDADQVVPLGWGGRLP